MSKPGPGSKNGYYDDGTQAHITTYLLGTHRRVRRSQKPNSVSFFSLNKFILFYFLLLLVLQYMILQVSLSEV